MIVEHQITCIKCYESKPSSEFYKSSLIRNHYICKVCHKQQTVNYGSKINKNKLKTEEDVLNLLVYIHTNRKKKIHKCEIEALSLNRIIIYNLLRQQDFKCAYLNKSFIGVTNKLFYPSIDRIDSNYGYKEGNVQIVCRGLNLAKNKFSDKDFREFLLSIKENYI